MTTPFVGEIQLFGFNYAPNQWAACNGALLPIRQNTALFALLNNAYGGDGKNNFGLPNLVNRAATSQGQGQGLTNHPIGTAYGAASVALGPENLPSHQLGLTLYRQPDEKKRSSTPTAGSFLGVPSQSTPFVPRGTPDTQFSSKMVPPVQGGQAHENRQPYLALNFCIALSGVYPSFG